MLLILLVIVNAIIITAEENDSFETRYIDLLPPKEKRQFVERIARRILEEVKSKDEGNTSRELTEDQVNQHSAYVSKLLKEEAENLRRNKKEFSRRDTTKVEDVEKNKAIDLTLRELAKHELIETSHEADKIAPDANVKNATDNISVEVKIVGDKKKKKVHNSRIFQIPIKPGPGPDSTPIRENATMIVIGSENKPLSEKQIKKQGDEGTPVKLPLHITREALFKDSPQKEDNENKKKEKDISNKQQDKVKLDSNSKDKINKTAAEVGGGKVPASNSRRQNGENYNKESGKSGRIGVEDDLKTLGNYDVSTTSSKLSDDKKYSEKLIVRNMDEKQSERNENKDGDLKITTEANLHNNNNLTTLPLQEKIGNSTQVAVPGDGTHPLLQEPPPTAIKPINDTGKDETTELAKETTNEITTASTMEPSTEQTTQPTTEPIKSTTETGKEVTTSETKTEHVTEANHKESKKEINTVNKDDTVNTGNKDVLNANTTEIVSVTVRATSDDDDSTKMGDLSDEKVEHDVDNTFNKDKVTTPAGNGESTTEDIVKARTVHITWYPGHTTLNYDKQNATDNEGEDNDSRNSESTTEDVVKARTVHITWRPNRTTKEDKNTKEELVRAKTRYVDWPTEASPKKGSNVKPADLTTPVPVLTATPSNIENIFGRNAPVIIKHNQVYIVNDAEDFRENLKKRISFNSGTNINSRKNKKSKPLKRNKESKPKVNKSKKDDTVSFQIKPFGIDIHDKGKTWNVFEVLPGEDPFVKLSGKPKKPSKTTPKPAKKNTPKYKRNKVQRANDRDVQHNVKRVDDIVSQMEQPHYAPVYNYAPENAYFNPDNRYAAPEEDIDQNPENEVKQIERQILNEGESLAEQNRQDKHYVPIHNYAPENAYYNPENRYDVPEEENEQIFRDTDNNTDKKLIERQQEDYEEIVRSLLADDEPENYILNREQQAQMRKGRKGKKKITEHIPDSNEADHPYNAMLHGEPPKPHLEHVREMLHKLGYYGYGNIVKKTTANPYRTTTDRDLYQTIKDKIDSSLDGINTDVPDIVTIPEPEARLGPNQSKQPSHPPNIHGSKTAPKPGSEIAAKPGSKVAEKPGSKIASKPGSDIAAKPGSKIAAKPESKIASRPESKIASRPESKIAPKLESKIAPKLESKTTPKPWSKTTTTHPRLFYGRQTNDKSSHNSYPSYSLPIIQLRNRDTKEKLIEVLESLLNLPTKDNVEIMRTLWNPFHRIEDEREKRKRRRKRVKEDFAFDYYWGLRDAQRPDYEDLDEKDDVKSGGKSKEKLLQALITLLSLNKDNVELMRSLVSPFHRIKDDEEKRKRKKKVKADFSLDYYWGLRDERRPDYEDLDDKIDTTANKKDRIMEVLVKFLNRINKDNNIEVRSEREDEERRKKKDKVKENFSLDYYWGLRDEKKPDYEDLDDKVHTRANKKDIIIKALVKFLTGINKNKDNIEFRSKKEDEEPRKNKEKVKEDFALDYYWGLRDARRPDYEDLHEKVYARSGVTEATEAENETQTEKTDKHAEMINLMRFFLNVTDAAHIVPTLEKVQDMYKTPEPKEEEATTESGIKENKKVILRSLLSNTGKIQDALESQIAVLTDMINTDARALDRYDWLATTVDVRAAVKKLIQMSESVKTDGYIHPRDFQLLKYVLYLYGSVKESLIADEEFAKSRGQRKARRNGLMEKPWLSRSGMKERLDAFEDFWRAIDLALMDLHEAITHISLITKFRSQHWFKNLKELYLAQPKRKQVLEVLLHLLTTRFVGLIEDNALDGAERNYVKYSLKHPKDVERTRDELFSIVNVLKELQKEV